ncbi:hypothetical protein [[Clostridium] innocuum]
MAGSLSGAATSLKTLFLVKQDKGKRIRFRGNKRSTTVFFSALENICIHYADINKSFIYHSF